MAESFTTTNRYFDNKHYPRGFSRHGDFTIKEAQLLERHGHAFNDLDLGKREPVTEEELAASRKLKAQKTTPKLMINKKGVMPFFYANSFCK